MKHIKARGFLIILLLASSLVLVGFGAGRLTVSNQEPQGQKGILILDPSKRLKVKVQDVVDGDDVLLVGGERVRFEGIDAPELDERGGKEALEELRKLVERREVELEFDPEAESDLRDVHGRLLAYIWLGESLINEELLKRGLAEVISEGIQKNFKYKERFLKAQKYAQENKLGIWAD